jgi:hypothetical protein
MPRLAIPLMSEGGGIPGGFGKVEEEPEREQEEDTREGSESAKSEATEGSSNGSAGSTASKGWGMWLKPWAGVNAVLPQIATW